MCSWHVPHKLGGYAILKADTQHEETVMDLHGLPTDLAQFVQQELASGMYQSEDELMAEALRLLKERVSRREALHQLANRGNVNTSSYTPDDYVCDIGQALAIRDAGAARQLALEGAKRYPEHAELRKCAYVLAPPPGKVMPSTPERRAAVKANGTWLKAHGQEYRGQWIALRAGQLLHASPSFDALIAQVGDVRGRNILVTQIT